MEGMRKLSCGVAVWMGWLPGLAAPVFHLNPPRLPDAAVGREYTGGPLLVQGGGQCPNNAPSVRLVGGALPRGIYLSPAGQFGGAPSELGRFDFVVRVQNGCGWSDQAMTIEVGGPALLLANPAALEFRVARGQAVPPETVQISSNISGLAYTVDSSVAWVRARAKSGRTPASGSALTSDLIEIELDTATLPPGHHRASLDIGGWRMAQPVTVPVRVEVLETPAATSSDPRIPRITMPQPAAEPAGAAVAPLSLSASPAAAILKPHAASPGRLSRSAQLRSKYLASKPPVATAAPPKPAAPAPAAEHAKPSPVGEAVKKAGEKHPPAAAPSHDKPKEAPKH
jgi:hypothetical protein